MLIICPPIDTTIATAQWDYSICVVQNATWGGIRKWVRKKEGVYIRIRKDAIPQCLSSSVSCCTEIKSGNSRL